MSDNLNKVEDIIYGSFVKMNRLEKIVFETFNNTSIAQATELNIFIDLYSVLKSIFSESYRTDISDYTAITTGIINMCSHYRSFFKRLSVRTKFYLVFSFNTCDINRKFVAGYNQTFMDKSNIKIFNEVAMNNFELLDLLCPYLPDIFFIKSLRNYESGVIIANLIEKVGINIPNLIISKDLYPLQLCNLYPYTSYLYPIKKKGGIDESIMIPLNEKPSFKYEFWNLIARKRGFNLDKVVNLSPINFPLFMSLTRFPERDIPTVCTVDIAKNIIYKLIGEENIKLFPELLYNDEEISSKIAVSVVESRFKTLDIPYMLQYYKNDPESKNINLQNLSDPGAVNTINSKFFSHNPIDLDKL